jgi:hypothetical protein
MSRLTPSPIPDLAAATRLLGHHILISVRNQAGGSRLVHGIVDGLEGEDADPILRIRSSVGYGRGSAVAVSRIISLRDDGMR